MKKKALAVLTEQLGKPFEGYEGLSPCRRALAVAFLAMRAGTRRDASLFSTPFPSPTARKPGRRLVLFWKTATLPEN